MVFNWEMDEDLSLQIESFATVNLLGFQKTKLIQEMANCTFEVHKNCVHRADLMSIYGDSVTC